MLTFSWSSVKIQIMKKVTIKGVDGKEIPAYICSDHPANFPTDTTGHKVEEVDLNNLSELDVNENSAGCGAHEEAQKKCCGGGCHSEAAEVHDHPVMNFLTEEQKFPNMLGPDVTEEQIKEWVEKKKVEVESKYDYPLDKAFDYGYSVDVDPINKLFKMSSEIFGSNKIKVEIDDTIDSDLLETEDLKLGRLYRIAGVNLVVRLVGQIIVPEEVEAKTLLQVKHHGTILYVGEKSLIRASSMDVKNYLNEPF
jgi:hypothetical protein